MQLKITRSGSRRYLQLVQAYRDPDTGRPKQRHVASLGRLDQISEGDLDSLINGLLRVTGRPLLGEMPEDSGHRSPLEPGITEARLTLVQSLLTDLSAVEKHAKTRTDQIVEHYVAAVLDRLLGSAPHAVVSVPNNVPVSSAVQGAGESMCAASLTGATSTEGLVLDLYCMTGIPQKRTSAQGTPTPVLAIERLTSGLPLRLHVLETQPTFRSVMASIGAFLVKNTRYKSLIVMADRTLTSGVDLGGPLFTQHPKEAEPRFILEVPIAQLIHLDAVRSTLHGNELAARIRNQDRVALEVRFGTTRIILGCNRERAARQRRARARAAARAIRLGRALASRLDSQDNGVVGPFGSITDAQATSLLQTAIYDLDLARLMRSAVDEEGFFIWYWVVDELLQALRLDGWIALVSNAEGAPEQLLSFFEGHQRAGVMLDSLAVDELSSPTALSLTTLALAVEHLCSQRLGAGSTGMSTDQVWNRLGATQELQDLDRASVAGEEGRGSGDQSVLAEALADLRL